jgi:hypothetical protein
MAAFTASIASAVTRGDAFTTRETVDRETPARDATISKVGAALDVGFSIVTGLSRLARL